MALHIKAKRRHGALGQHCLKKNFTKTIQTIPQNCTKCTLNSLQWLKHPSNRKINRQQATLVTSSTGHSRHRRFRRRFRAQQIVLERLQGHVGHFSFL